MEKESLMSMAKKKISRLRGPKPRPTSPPSSAVDAVDSHPNSSSKFVPAVMNNVVAADWVAFSSK